MSIIQESFEDDKYRVFFHNGAMHALRHGKYWRELTGDKLVLCMLQEVEELRQFLKDTDNMNEFKEWRNRG